MIIIIDKNFRKYVVLSYFKILYNFIYLRKLLKLFRKYSTSFNEHMVFFLQHLNFSVKFLGLFLGEFNFLGILSSFPFNNRVFIYYMKKI